MGAERMRAVVKAASAVGDGFRLVAAVPERPANRPLSSIAVGQKLSEQDVHRRNSADG